MFPLVNYGFRPRDIVLQCISIINNTLYPTMLFKYIVLTMPIHCVKYGELLCQILYQNDRFIRSGTYLHT